MRLSHPLFCIITPALAQHRFNPPRKRRVAIQRGRVLSKFRPVNVQREVMGVEQSLASVHFSELVLFGGADGLHFRLWAWHALIDCWQTVPHNNEPFENVQLVPRAVYRRFAFTQYHVKFRKRHGISVVSDPESFPSPVSERRVGKSIVML